MPLRGPHNHENGALSVEDSGGSWSRMKVDVRLVP
jgi:hypothetical protein